MASHLIKGKLPCPISPCQSSDGYHLYSDGHGYCFSCGKSTFPNKREETLEDDTGFTYQYVPYRSINREVLEEYEAKTKISPEGKPLGVGHRFLAETFKYKALDNKEDIRWVGPTKEVGLLGEHLFPAGSAKAITVTEGEEDAYSVRQMFDRKYPAVSLPHGAQSARKALANRRDYLNSFERIYLCFDADKPGRQAMEEGARLFDFTKVYLVNLSKHKDANDYLQAGDTKDFIKEWWAAKRYTPEDIISTLDEFSAILKDTSKGVFLPLPFPTLNGKLDGLMTGKSILIKGQEGLGKTELLRRFESYVLENTDVPVGIIHLEEDKKRNLQGLAGHKLRLPTHLRDSSVSVEDTDAALRELVKRDDRLFTYSHFGTDDPHVLVDNVRILGSVFGCKLITFDPFNHSVTGVLEEDLRKLLDMMIMSIHTLAQDHDFAFVYTAHTNPDGSTRDSKLLSKVAHVVLNLKRDPMHESEYMRRITEIIIEKNRPTSVTGPAGKLIFNPDTFMLSELTEDLPT